MKKERRKDFYIPYRGWFLNTSDAVRSIINENYKLDTEELIFIFNNVLTEEQLKNYNFDSELDIELSNSIIYLIEHLVKLTKTYELGLLKNVLNKDFKFTYLYQFNKETCMRDKDRTANLDKYFVGYFFVCNNKEMRDLIVAGAENIKARELEKQKKEKEEKFKNSLTGKVYYKLKKCCKKPEKTEDVTIIND